MTVIFTRLARRQIVELYDYIAEQNSFAVALKYTTDLVAACQGMSTLPHRGTKRDDIRPGLRTIGFRRRVTIAFVVTPKQVRILGIFYGGQDFAAILQK